MSTAHPASLQKGYVSGPGDRRLRTSVLLAVAAQSLFLVFLPPILQSAGYWASPRELRAELVTLTWLVLGLTLATMVIVAVVAETVIPSINWAEAFVLGAMRGVKGELGL